METCKYCGRPSYGYCCPLCWDDFERGEENEKEEQDGEEDA